MKLLKSSFVLPITDAPIVDGAVLLKEGKIAEVGPASRLLEKYSNVPVEDLSNAVLMPGLVNAHSHLDLLFSPEQEFPSFFEKLLSTWELRRRLTPADRRHAMEEGIQQLLASGTTCVGDVGEFVGVLAQIVNSPIRMVLFPELLSGGSPAENYEGFFAQVDEIVSSQSSRVRGGMAPYSAYTLSRHLLKLVAEHGRQMKIPVKIHVGETFAEMQFFYESQGEVVDWLFPKIGWTDITLPELRKTPVQYLDSIGFLDSSPILIGCNHLSDGDIQTISKKRAKVVFSPRSHGGQKLGLPPVRKLLAAGVPVALGTDGVTSSLSLWEEMRFLSNHLGENESVSGDELIKMGTLYGARALGLSDKIGSIEMGKEADLIAIRLTKDAQTLTASDVASWLVSHVTPRDVKAIFVEGNPIRL